MGSALVRMKTTMRKNAGFSQIMLIAWPDALYSLMITRSTSRAQSMGGGRHAACYLGRDVDRNDVILPLGI